MGLPWTPSDEKTTQSGDQRQHWSFQPVKPEVLPANAGHPIDYFIRRAQAKAGVVPSPRVLRNCPGPPLPLVRGPASGAAFPKGATPVTLKAVDAAGRMSGNCMFTVTVSDNQPPTITCPAPITRYTDPGTCATVVTLSLIHISEPTRPS
mgnify:CR=1 FL=1